MKNRYQINYKSRKRDRLILLDTIEAHDLEDALHTYFKNFKELNYRVTPVLFRKVGPGLRVEESRPGQDYWEVFKL